jgi:mono/diheme cytochrome c family protein
MTLRLLPLAIVLLVAAGCGGGETVSPTAEETVGSVPATTAATASKGDPAKGKIVFTKTASPSCGGCHTLADAGTSGTVGPNLDDAKPSFDKVVERVTNGRGVMPSFKGKLTDQQIADVAAYVSQAAGKG